MVYLGLRIMDKNPVERGVEDVIRTYELLDRVRLGRDIVIRDDQFAREALFDAARLVRSKGIGLSLIDTGRFEPGDLEWLIREGVRIYTSDEVRASEMELDRIVRACGAAKSFAAYFQNGPLRTGEAEGAVSVPALKRLCGSGLDLHLSNRTHARESGVVSELAENARDGRAFLAYYHHGPFAEGLPGLAERGAWIHFSDRSLRDGDPSGLGTEIARVALAAGSRAAVHVESGLPLPVLERLFAAGAVLLFRTPPSDRQSRQRSLEERARKRTLPVRACYLSPAFLP
jgi:hypothetical protein